jgi:hypothetical protein
VTRFLKGNEMKKQVIKGLRDVARAVYNNDFKGESGICWEFNPVNTTPLVKGTNYNTYNYLSVRMKTHLPRKLFLCYPGRQWEQRAMFCLLLAEMIEQEK